jgi:origin of replication binding protein
MNITRRQPKLHITLVDSVQTSKIKPVSESWDVLSIRLTKKPVITTDRESLKWPLFVPFKMLTEEEGALMRETAFGRAYSRRKLNIKSMNVLVLDYDNDPKLNHPTLTFDEAIKRFDGLACAMYTSFNHKNTYKGNVDKFRIVLPLTDTVEIEEVESRKEALMKLFPEADPASFVPSQPFYVPIAHPDRVNLHRSHENSGEFFDLLSLVAVEPVSKAKIPATAFVQTGEMHSDLPTIKIRGGAIYRADELWNHLQEGYDNKVGCYKIGAADKKPGCFVYRLGGGLSYYDPAVGKAVFLKVMKQKKVWNPDAPPEDDVAVETIKLWDRKPRKTPEPKASKAKSVSKPTEVIEYPEEGQVELRKLNQRFLPDDLHLDIPTDGVTYIRSPKGTGKTKILERLTSGADKNGESVLMLGHRVYLLQNLAGRTNLDYYRDLDDGQTTSSMALCMNSLTRIDPSVDEPYNTVIIDESEQVFQALISSMLHRELATIWNNLLWVFRKAKRIICLDADLTSDLTMELIKEIRGERKTDNVLGVINEFRIGEGQTTKIYEKHFHLLADALDAIHQGEKVFIACNSKRFAIAVDAIIKDMGKTCLLVTADTNEEEATQDFIANPTAESKKYDVIVSSPTLSTGVSIGDPEDPTTNHFTTIYGFFWIKPGTFQDIDQAISRVRTCRDVSVWVQGHKKKHEVSANKEQEIYDKVLDRERGTLKKIYDEETFLTQGQLKWAAIYARIVYMLEIWSYNKDEQFCSMRRDLGFEIQPVLADAEANRAGASIYSQFKDVGIDRALAVFDAAEIDDEEYLELMRKKQRSHAEKLSIEKFRLFDMLRDQNWSVETVRSALKQELLQSLAKIRTLHLFSDENRKADDRNDRLKNASTFTASRHRVKQKELIDHLCKEAKLDLDTLFEKAQGDEETEIPIETLSALAKAYDERKKDFNYYFNSRIKNPTQNTTKVWATTFGDHFSLCIKRKKQTVAKKKREYRYFLDLTKKDLVHKVMKEREYY